MKRCYHPAKQLQANYGMIWYSIFGRVSPCILLRYYSCRVSRTRDSRTVRASHSAVLGFGTLRSGWARTSMYYSLLPKSPKKKRRSLCVVDWASQCLGKSVTLCATFYRHIHLNWEKRGTQSNAPLFLSSLFWSLNLKNQSSNSYSTLQYKADFSAA